MCISYVYIFLCVSMFLSGWDVCEIIHFGNSFLKGMNSFILEFNSKPAVFSKLLRRPNHYAYEIGIEVLSRTPAFKLTMAPRQQETIQTQFPGLNTDLSFQVTTATAVVSQQLSPFVNTLVTSHTGNTYSIGVYCKFRLSTCSVSTAWKTIPYEKGQTHFCMNSHTSWTRVIG